MRASAYLVDLAGSEDIGDGGDRDSQMETTAINASLFHLRRVVEDLASAQVSTNQHPSPPSAWRHLHTSRRPCVYAVRHLPSTTSRSLSLSLSPLSPYGSNPPGAVARAQAAGEARELQHSLRSSKLTEALRGALAGASDTAVVLAVSPSSSHEVESERTLRFGLAAARVRTADEANVEVSPEVAVVQEQIDEQIAVIAEVCVCVCVCVRVRGCA